MMKQIIPSDIYRGLPCSVVSVGCACQIEDLNSLSAFVSDDLHNDGYLSLDGMNRLIRANKKVKKTQYFRRWERPTLKDWACEYPGQKAVICLLGHFIYFDGQDYHSFFENDNDPVVKVWFLL